MRERRELAGQQQTGYYDPFSQGITVPSAQFLQVALGDQPLDIALSNMKLAVFRECDGPIGASSISIASHLQGPAAATPG
jgi:hypothetical protein